MSLQKDFEKLKAFDDGIAENLKEINVSEADINRIIHLIHLDNYLQVLYSYEEHILKRLLEYFLSIEDYQQCASIRDCVANHNKATGDQIKLI